MTVREKIAEWHRVWWLNNLPEYAGAFWLALHRFIHPQLTTGLRPRVWGGFHVMMYPDSRIEIGDDLRMVSLAGRAGITAFHKCKFTTFPGAQIHIGNGVAMTATSITSKKSVRIGDRTMIAPNVIIVDSDFHVPWPPEARWNQPCNHLDAAVDIGANVWIGMNSLILKGVTIGDNSIIAAGSVVQRSIPANVVAAGNPARVVKKLGDGEMCAELHAEALPE